MLGNHADESGTATREMKVVEDKYHNFVMGRRTSRVTGNQVVKYVGFTRIGGMLN